MVGPPMDCLNNPLGAVRTLFEKACAQSGCVRDSQSDGGVREVFDNYLYQQGGFMQVPEINSVPLGAIPNSTLVRFRGMVQDMFDVEYYLGAYKEGMVWRTTKFTDLAQVSIPETSDSQVWDRRVLYCVPVPGESKWVKNAFSSSPLFTSMVNSQDSVISHTEKRHREPEESNDVEMDSESKDEPKESKRLKEELITTCGTIISETLDLNMPLGESSLLPCIVKVYDSVDSEIKLNDVVEFTGVLTFDPELSSGSFNSASGTPDCPISPFMEEDVSSQLPASRVPRLHCISYRKLSPHKILEAFPNTEGNICGLMGTQAAIRELRVSILEGLTNVLGGDHLTAEYLLLHLLSQVYTRVDSMALGKISLNIVTGESLSSDLSFPLVTALAEAIQDLLPCSHLLPLSLQNLNKGLMAPQKDYNTNRLVTGCLQLAEGTYLTLDETALSTGELNNTGIQNIQSLKYLMAWQKVEYDFQYYKLDMPTDIPVLIISNARSRLLPADIVVPLRSTTNLTSFSVKDSEVVKWRYFLSSVRNLGHTLEPSMMEFVQDELVHARQSDRSLTPEIFHRWLTLARLMSLSYGESTLSMERWQMLREMERCCAKRLAC